MVVIYLYVPFYLFFFLYWCSFKFFTFLIVAPPLRHTLSLERNVILKRWRRGEEEEEEEEEEEKQLSSHPLPAARLTRSSRM